MYDANEIGLDWKGSIETLSSVIYAKPSYITASDKLKDSNGKERCRLNVEETLADNTLGKLVWAKRDGKDVLVKRPISQRHSRQEAVIQWLVNKNLTQHGLGEHCPRVYDIFSMSDSYWFSMEPVYSAPMLNTYITSLPNPSDFSNLELYPNPLNSQRHNQEFWICYRKDKHASLWESNIDCYQRHLHPYPINNYIFKDDNI